MNPAHGAIWPCDPELNLVILPACHCIADGLFGDGDIHGMKRLQPRFV